MCLAAVRRMPKITVLVEGITEETFIREVLNPHFMARRPDVYLHATIVQTKRLPSGGKYRGGITKYRHFREDALRYAADTGASVITSMIDLYHLPPDFPGYAQAMGLPLRARVKVLEEAIASNINCLRFIPYISTHEFEALVLADPSVLADVLGATAEDVDALRVVVNQFQSPEEVNGDFAPSDRIEAILPTYDKVRHGPVSTERIGIAALKDQCLHFREWIESLELAIGRLRS